MRFKKLKESLLPPKKFVKNQSVEFLNGRQSDLQSYLRTILELEVILQRRKSAESLPRPLSLFLDFHKYEVHSIVEKLCENLYLTGEDKLATGQYVEFNTIQLWAITQRWQMNEPTCEGTDVTLDFGHLVDFCHRLENLKIVGISDRFGTSNVCPNQLPFSLQNFKSLRKVMFLGVNFAKISGFSVLKSGQTASLKAHCCLAQFQELLRGPDGFELAPSGAFPASLPHSWTGVKFVDFSSNQLNEIDDSVTLLESVEILNLSGNNIGRLSDSLAQLTCLSELNLSNNRMVDIPDCHLRLGQLKRLILARNQICSLEGLSKLYSLEYLDVQHNHISHVANVCPIGRLPCLEVLLLIGNPVESSMDYRTRVLEGFVDRYAEVKLDGRASTSQELNTVAVRLAIRKAQEDRLANSNLNSNEQNPMEKL